MSLDWIIPARSIEWPQIRQRNHPLHGEMDTSRIEEVKPPQHDGTPRSRVFFRVPDVAPPAVASPKSLQLSCIKLAALHPLLVGLSSTTQPGHALPRDSARRAVQPQLYSSVRRLATSPIGSEVGHDLPTRSFLEELLGLGQLYTSTVFPRTKTKKCSRFYYCASSFQQGFALYERFQARGGYFLASSHIQITHPERSGAQLPKDTFG